MKVKLNKKLILEEFNKPNEFGSVPLGMGLAGGALGLYGGSLLGDQLDTSTLATGGLSTGGALLGYGLGKKLGYVVDNKTEPENNQTSQVK